MPPRREQPNTSWGVTLPTMSPSLEGKLWNQGCFVVFVSLIGLGIFAYFVDRRFAFAAVGLVVVWLIICRIHAYRENKRLAAAFQKAFETFDGFRPELKRTSSYGYPFFSVCFRTKEEMNQAFESGHLKAFRTAIAELYGFGGFDIEKGFDETYVGWEQDFRESMKSDPSGNFWIEKKLKQRAEHYGASDGDK